MYHESGTVQGVRWQYKMVGPQLKRVRHKALQAVVYGALKSDRQHPHLSAGHSACGVVQTPRPRMEGRLGNDKHFASGQPPEQAAFLLMT